MGMEMEVSILSLFHGIREKDSRFNGGMGSQARYAPTGFPHEVSSVIQERYRGKFEHFQKRSFLSPYADARGLEAGSKEFDKRAIAVMHELLSFTLGKRLVTDHLIHFRKEFVISEEADEDFFNFFWKHCGIFYVSERGKRISVCLRISLGSDSSCALSPSSSVFYKFWYIH